MRQSSWMKPRDVIDEELVRGTVDGDASARLGKPEEEGSQGVSRAGSGIPGVGAFGEVRNRGELEVVRAGDVEPQPPPLAADLDGVTSHELRERTTHLLRLVTLWLARETAVRVTSIPIAIDRDVGEVLDLDLAQPVSLPAERPRIGGGELTAAENAVIEIRVTVTQGQDGVPRPVVAQGWLFKEVCVYPQAA